MRPLIAAASLFLAVSAFVPMASAQDFGGGSNPDRPVVQPVRPTLLVCHLVAGRTSCTRAPRLS